LNTFIIPAATASQFRIDSRNSSCWSLTCQLACWSLFMVYKTYAKNPCQLKRGQACALVLIYTDHTLIYHGIHSMLMQINAIIRMDSCVMKEKMGNPFTRTSMQFSGKTAVHFFVVYWAGSSSGQECMDVNYRNGDYHAVNLSRIQNLYDVMQNCYTVKFVSIACSLDINRWTFSFTIKNNNWNMKILMIRPFAYLDIIAFTLAGASLNITDYKGRITFVLHFIDRPLILYDLWFYGKSFF